MSCDCRATEIVRLSSDGNRTTLDRLQSYDCRATAIVRLSSDCNRTTVERLQSYDSRATAIVRLSNDCNRTIVERLQSYYLRAGDCLWRNRLPPPQFSYFLRMSAMFIESQERYRDYQTRPPCYITRPEPDADPLAHAWRLRMSNSRHIIAWLPFVYDRLKHCGR